MKVAFTGHRPTKLGWGYDYTEHHWVKLKDVIKNQLIKLHATDVYSGMALGVDTVAALAVLELNQEQRFLQTFYYQCCCNLDIFELLHAIQHSQILDYEI